MDSFILCASMDSAYRGYEYYKKDMVVSVEHKGGGVYSGVVRGSGGAAYDVTVNIKRPRSGSCTCPHAAGRRIICKHMAALYFAVLPERAEQYIAEIEANDAEAEDYQAELWRRVESCVWGMKRTELQAALLRLLAEGPEWQYERFAREYARE